MSTTTVTSTEATMLDEIAQAVVLPESYLDEKAISYPAFEWLRENNPLGVARVEGYDPLWIVTKYADIQKIEVDNKAFGVGDQNPILATQAGDDFFRSLPPGGRVRNMDVVVYMDPPSTPRSAEFSTRGSGRAMSGASRSSSGCWPRKRSPGSSTTTVRSTSWPTSPAGSP